MLVNFLSWFFHYGITIDELQNTIVFFFTIAVATIPTRVFPDPQGSTITPDRALFSINTFDNAFS
jgi:hypothetical protein